MSALIEFDAVCKYYQMGDTLVKAADHISMQINQGEFVAIVGQSGSGKSTCMNIIGCLDVPTEGTYKLNGRDVGSMNTNELAEIRNEMLGFIFQQYKPAAQAGPDGKRGGSPGVCRGPRRRTAPAGPNRSGAGGPGQKAPQQAQPALGRPAAAGLHCPGPGRRPGGDSGRRAHRRPGQPHRREVLGMLQKLHQQGNTVVLITHDNSIAVQAERIIRLEDGHIVYDGDATPPTRWFIPITRRNRRPPHDL